MTRLAALTLLVVVGCSSHPYVSDPLEGGAACQARAVGPCDPTKASTCLYCWETAGFLCACNGVGDGGGYLWQCEGTGSQCP